MPQAENSAQEVDPGHQNDQSSWNVESPETGLPYQPAAAERSRAEKKVREGRGGNQSNNKNTKQALYKNRHFLKSL